MIFHENRLLGDDSHEISYLIFSIIGKDVVKFVVCCSCDWRFKGQLLFESLLPQTLVRIANSDVTDQTALGLHCLSMTSGQVEQVYH